MSDINIINAAFRKLGEHGISGTEQSPNGIEAARAYDNGLELYLSSADWVFATKRATLAPLVDKPTNGWNYKYALPSDYLKLKKYGIGYKNIITSDVVLAPDIRYSIEGKEIFCDEEDAIDISYIAKINDSSLFDPDFKEALTYYIAADLASFINPKRVLEMKEEAERYLKKAKRKNELNRDMETMPDNTWVTARLSVDGTFSKDI